MRESAASKRKSVGVKEKELDERELDVRGDEREGIVIESGIREMWMG